MKIFTALHGTLLNQQYLKSFLFCILFSSIAINSFSEECDLIIESSNDDVVIIRPCSFNSLSPGDTISLSAGNYSQIFIQSIHGTLDLPIIIRNLEGKVTINNSANFGIAFHDCSHIKLLGNGCTETEYGLAITGTNGNGISVDQKSTNIEIGHVEISHTRMSGIMVKTSPLCGDLSSVRENFTLYEANIHNNYIHNTGNEGLYVGSSFYNGRILNCNDEKILVFEHEIKGVQIFNNILERTGRNSIQVSSATESCYIYNNTIIEDSYKGISGFMNGIQVGGGSRCDVFNNKIIDGKGGGIHYFGNGGAKIYNNLIVNPGRTHHPELPLNNYPVHGIFVMHVFTDTADPINIFHNTIINPKTDGIKFTNKYTRNNKIQNNIVVNPGAYQYIGLRAYVNIMPPEITTTVSHNFFETNSENIHFSDTLALDFSLSEISPTINEGTNLRKYRINFDITDAPRPIGRGYDIGAYEYQSRLPVVPRQHHKFEFKIFPNPARGFINFKFNRNTKQAVRISLFDISGNLVLNHSVVNFYTDYSLPVSHIPPGFYYVRIQSGSFLATSSFINL